MVTASDDIPHEKTWIRLRKGNLKRKTESLLIAAQNNAIRINYIYIYPTPQHEYDVTQDHFYTEFNRIDFRVFIGIFPTLYGNNIATSARRKERNMV